MSVSYTPDEPIVAIATSLAPSALGVVRTSGTGAVALVSKAFSRPAALTDAAGNTIVHGWIVDSDGAKIDEVLVLVFRAPKSFTGEEAAEVMCHGGVAVVRAVHKVLLDAGFRQAQRGEFTFRAYINGKTDLTRAEAVAEIVDSRTVAAASRAARRLAGTLAKEAEAIKTLLIDTLAKIEVEVEYPEDEGASNDSAFDANATLRLPYASLEDARDKLKRLADTWNYEKLYQDGARVVLCGAPNAGKSSLFNALLKEERSIVSEAAGTTRDWIEAWADFDGIPVKLIDTAGLHTVSSSVTADVAIEAQGIKMARQLAEDADIVLYVVDGTKGVTSEDNNFLCAHAQTPCVVLWNKADKDAYNNTAGDAFHVIRTSCKTGEGITSVAAAVAQLLNRRNCEAMSSSPITHRISAGSMHRISAGSMHRSNLYAALGSERQKDAVQSALVCVSHALDAANGGYPMDAVGQDIEDALESIGILTGEVKAEDVLDSVFSHFCVGK